MNPLFAPSQRVASVLILGLLLASCGPEEVILPSVPNNASAGDLVTEPCSYGRDGESFQAECGVLIVPENRENPDSRLIALKFTRVRSTSSDPAEPIFFLEGGPGISNAYFSRVRYFLDNHDFVLVGYRGIDGSERFECPEVSAYFADPPGDLFDPISLEAMAEAYHSCAARLESEGIDLLGYNMVAVIDDMEAAADALGYKRINLLSQSYGTRLALLYAWLHPDRIKRSAMIGVNPPGHFVWHPEVVDAQLAYYARLCAGDARCSSRTDDLAATMRAVAQDMPERWLVFPVKRGHVLVGTFLLLSDITTSPAVFDAWLDAADCDASGFAAMSMMLDFVFPRASVWGESAAKAVSADVGFIPEGDFNDVFMPASSIIGAPVSVLWAGAKGWKASPIPDSLTVVRESDVDMLLIGGNIDFSTPVEAATEELMPHLSNAEQVVLKDFGHTSDVWNLQPEATRRLLKTYFDEGRVDKSGYHHQDVNFEVKWRFALIAKLGVLAILVVLSLFGLIVWAIMRKLRKR
jgi:pimeloyl-ACP methyl ester carboxylesterase